MNHGRFQTDVYDARYFPNEVESQSQDSRNQVIPGVTPASSGRPPRLPTPAREGLTTHHRIVRRRNRPLGSLG